MSLKPFTNEVILEPLDERGQILSSGIFIVNHYRHATLKWKVIAVGPAGLVKRKNRKGKDKWVYRAPEVKVGDTVICRAQLEAEVVKKDFGDGSKRVVVDSEKIMAVYETQ